MKNLDVSKSFKNRKLKYGGYATLMTAVVLAILLVVNLVAGKLDLKVDLTKNKLYSLSDQTFKLIDGLNSDVKIYVFSEAGKDDPTLMAIVNKYTARSKKITLETKDPVKYPQYAKKYSQNGTDVQVGSIVIESGSKFKLIDPNDFVNYSYDQNGQASADSLAIEQRITSALMFVTSNKNPIILTLKGHEEPDISAELKKGLENQNYTINDVNLLQKDAKITEGATLMVASPKRDLSAEEASTIKNFLANGGKAIFMMDITADNMPNFQAVLNAYGVGLQKAIVVEGDANFSTSNPIYLLPDMGSHDIVKALKAKNVPLLIPAAQPIELLKIKKNTTTIEPILSSSKNSWAKKNLQATTSNKETGDLTGPFNIAVAITDKLSDDDTKNTKIVLVSDGVFSTSQFVTNGGNLDFAVNSLNWIETKTDTISVSPKSLDTGRLTMSVFQQLIYSGIVVVLIPVAIIVRGVMVLLRRKRQ